MIGLIGPDGVGKSSLFFLISPARVIQEGRIEVLAAIWLRRASAGHLPAYRLYAGRFSFALNIPPEFQRNLLAGRAPTIQLNVDATRMSQAFIGSVAPLNISWSCR